MISKSITRMDGSVGKLRGRDWRPVDALATPAVTDAVQAVVLERLSEAQDEALRIQLELDAVNASLVMAEEACDGPAMARWYAHEAELLHRRAEIADHVSAIAAALWTPGEPLATPSRSLRVLH